MDGRAKPFLQSNNLFGIGRGTVTKSNPCLCDCGNEMRIDQERKVSSLGVKHSASSDNSANEHQ